MCFPVFISDKVMKISVKNLFILNGLLRACNCRLFGGRPRAKKKTAGGGFCNQLRFNQVGIWDKQGVANRMKRFSPSPRPTANNIRQTNPNARHGVYANFRTTLSLMLTLPFTRLTNGRDGCGKQLPEEISNTQRAIRRQQSKSEINRRNSIDSNKTRAD